MIISAFILATCLQHGAVATAEIHATQASDAILKEEGGNAIDAAITASFALAVTYPTAGNIGGGGFMLYREPEGLAWFLDFREVAPAAGHPEMYLDENGELIEESSTLGWKAVGVPGSVFGMWEAHKLWGSLPWESLLEPAIELAASGFPISEAEHRRLTRLAKTLGKDPYAFRSFYNKDGSAKDEGSLLIQPELAVTLRRIAKQGVSAFRKGPIVKGIVETSQKGGGVLAEEDFIQYRPEFRPVQKVRWRDLTILAATAPSSSGLFLSQTLGMLSDFPLASWGWEDPRTVQVLGEVEARAFAIRNRWMGDPIGCDFGVAALSHPTFIKSLGSGISPNRFTRPRSTNYPAPWESKETTHYSIVDSRGAAVSVTTTLNSGYGAKVMAPGGFLMNNEMDDFATRPGYANQFGLIQGKYNQVIPGRRPLSSMSPIIVVRDGQVDSVIGSPGGPTILTTVLQVFLNRYVFRMTPKQSVAAPRFHRQDLPATLKYEAGRLTSKVISRLRSLGQPLKKIRKLGNVDAVFRVNETEWIPVTDPRW
ncbi:MAG: gamma-glutamyltransferase [Planctomycetota bacterium]|jgi:gamma-glutamyltranspeptidase/glutathione hydrolase|nr:gamma-glutamyltransferase [Planctomycetota bacterium]MDP6942015.1 gamma-glutamyltransferase [Planctomycetota bacterium]